MTAQTLECEVLIVGRGPAGLSVAATLPNYIATIIVHQDAEIGKPVRTSGGCWLDDVERLGIPSEFYQVMHPPGCIFRQQRNPFLRSKMTN